MRVLITAGGTSEQIDQVRKITNSGTGRLGSLIADEFAAVTGTEVVYLCSEHARRPSAAAIEVRIIRSVADLEAVLQEQLCSRKFDAVIHTMAVSDYTKHAVFSIEDLTADLSALFREERMKGTAADGMEAAIKEVILKTEDASAGSSKLSSKTENLMLVMKQTPKLIGMIKQIQPHTCLIGFKLLVDVSRENLTAVASALMEKNDCDYVVANDLRNVGAVSHQALLIQPDGSYEELYTKKQIAEALVKKVLSRHTANE